MIKEVGPDDLKAIKTITEIYNSYLQNFEFPIDEKFLANSLQDENFKIFVDDTYGIIKGFCGIYFYPDSSAEIGPIAVGREFLNRHTGTALLQYILNFAKENKFKKCIARVSDKNLTAIKFFTDNGFIPETTAGYVAYFIKFLYPVFTN
ncbi:MAG: GNAT family N-acetyltransferase [Candidatus Altiarchaeum hamiconexum]|uniref:GNAT family N-acetyltransferase n=1 Tax=Candidatus Altarchaeum hamiconexum TaxID=1803513 RepID=A0A8J8CF22_9ARCH|nr:GNAT family N-acetyltransferase [Candidatus Altarchaeum hamiconexum]OIQ05371.1 MAG: hypothetical protein AUK59_04090 [Candidatus Altarchaeum sp. CG2_30_32_3053]PIN67016.1 MAG: hypothetical protein COV98_05175 [Candidatus Altarchaeum sp. CG12_big_fil_rev_8_21_14_0_65_33_22]PIV28880.1 MAG: hypothetical protein COS36_00690 [Candidatus Altarchaeum sp. CG03_land_8_20_14_0_80_32_618]PIZ29291.1 MAG: hypothetical protein COY41_06025 [Candidatus Altarchaeum sp. CG_4_10_14_0_8_um_filter_32_851]PJC157